MLFKVLIMKILYKGGQPKDGGLCCYMEIKRDKNMGMGITMLPCVALFNFKTVVL